MPQHLLEKQDMGTLHFGLRQAREVAANTSQPSCDGQKVITSITVLHSSSAEKDVTF